MNTARISMSSRTGATKSEPFSHLASATGFRRTHVERITDVAGGVAYLCKYLSKRRVPCLKRVRLWAAFGAIDRTRVSDVIVDSPFVRVLRNVMGSLSPDELRGVSGAPSS